MSATAVEAPSTAVGRKAGGPVLVVIPQGGVGRSTTVWHVAAELAIRGKRVRIEDLDQGAHLSGSSTRTRSAWTPFNWGTMAPRTW